MKKSLFFFLLFLLLGTNGLLIYKAYKNKTYPYYELGYLFRKIDREIKKITFGKEEFKSNIIEESYTNNSNLEIVDKLDTALLPLNQRNIDITKFVKFAKKGGSIAQAKDRLILMDRLGNIFSFKNNTIVKENLNVPNNIDKFIYNYEGKNIKFTSDSLRSYSIDFHKKSNRLFVSYTKFIKENIIKVVVSSVEYDFEKQRIISDWEDHFETENIYEAANISQGGGGKLQINNDNLYLTIGYAYFETRDNIFYSSASDQNSYTGKIIKINLIDDQIEIISSGHRNSQGITILNNGKILNTEHGPQGGDEINEIKSGKNYGYPFKVFGTSYGTYEMAGFGYKKEEMFEDPIYYFSPSIGISHLIQVNEFHEKWKNNLLVGSLKARSLYRVTYEDDKIISVEPIWIGERIRDLLIYDKQLFILTDNSNLKIINVDLEQFKIGFRYNNMGSGGNYVSLNKKISQCLQCHAFTATNPSSSAPTLHKIFGRKIGADNYQKYSKILKEKFINGDIWNEENLKSYLKNPQIFAPGSIKLNLGLDDMQVDEIISLLKEQSLQ